MQLAHMHIFESSSRLSTIQAFSVRTTSRWFWGMVVRPIAACVMFAHCFWSVSTLLAILRIPISTLDVCNLIELFSTIRDLASCMWFSMMVLFSAVLSSISFCIRTRCLLSALFLALRVFCSLINRQTSCQNAREV